MFAQTEAGDEVGESPASDRSADLDTTVVVNLQQQVNELRSDLLDERERRIDLWEEAHGAVLVVLGIMIGIGGLWAYAKFQSIATEARIGAAATRRYVLAPRGLIPGTGAPEQPLGEGLQPLPLLVSARLEAEPGTTASANGKARARPPAAPRLHAFRRTLSLDGLGRSANRAGLGPDDADLHRIEETIADCTEAIRLDPDSPRLYLERAGAYSSLDRYEQAVADYDRAIRLAPDDAAAYLGRCHAKSELGRHEEAIEDYDHAVCLDPASASASGDG